jgi:hypothetical protein
MRACGRSASVDAAISALAPSARSWRLFCCVCIAHGPAEALQQLRFEVAAFEVAVGDPLTQHHGASLGAAGRV